jgi:RNA polymerase sigma factor (sigma-70 family)
MKDDDFRSFVARERQRLVSYARSLVTETADLDAEDIVQDVLVKLIERRETMLSVENLVAYVYRSLKNRVIDLKRTRKPTVSLDAEVQESGGTFIELLKDTAPDVLETLQSMEGRRALFDALERLSEVERRVIIAHEFEGTPFKVLTSELGIPQNTLLSHKARGLRKLSRYLMKTKEADT